MRLLGARLAVAAGLLTLAITRPSAQDYPTRPITLIVPFAAGGPTDVIARIVGEHMSRTLGQTMVIENMVGAGGTTASTRAKRATPDGYTIDDGPHGDARRLGRALSQARLQAGCRFRADRHGRRHADPDPGEEGFSAQGFEGIRHLREGQ